MVFIPFCGQVGPYAPCTAHPSSFSGSCSIQKRSAGILTYPASARAILLEQSPARFFQISELSSPLPMRLPIGMFVLGAHFIERNSLAHLRKAWAMLPALSPLLLPC